ncbi:MAG: hypothetical protein LH475_07300 [Cryobacterium sp.]|uniref:hypothetical protein n=1 Tax=unclassified Cryobacterium TaxID=2649013 RepID=UPI0018C9CAFF|nr:MULTISPECIES: hypothetical protein [unclassified Cryobacterium]MCY7404415.1 hypothetical protein [Cryobacterium sp.]MEC5155777.1 hypothetical protein [Cryobacterium sp. CAN_C3]
MVSRAQQALTTGPSGALALICQPYGWAQQHNTAPDGHDEVDEEDPTSADILHGFIEKLEQYTWMVSAENRTTVKAHCQGLHPPGG